MTHAKDELDARDATYYRLLRDTFCTGDGTGQDMMQAAFDQVVGTGTPTPAQFDEAMALALSLSQRAG